MPKRCCAAEPRAIRARWRAAPLLALLAATAAAAADADCAVRLPDSPPAAQQTMGADGAMLAFAPNRWPLPVGQTLSLQIAICPPMTLLAVDADMPAHRHGMNYRPSLRALGDGRYAADGLLLHMPGRWRFIFDLALDGRSVRLTHEVDVP